MMHMYNNSLVKDFNADDDEAAGYVTTALFHFLSSYHTQVNFKELEHSR